MAKRLSCELFDLQTNFELDKQIYTDMKEAGQKVNFEEFDLMTLEELKALTFERYSEILSSRYKHVLSQKRCKIIEDGKVVAFDGKN